jgi:chemotaxis protein MotB
VSTDHQDSRAFASFDDRAAFGPAEDGKAGHDPGLVGLSTDWSVPWSDLMMVMFVLFVVLYVYEIAERNVKEAFGGKDPVPRQTLLPPNFDEPSFDPSPRKSVFEESRELVRTAGLEDVDVVLQSDRSVKVSVQGTTYFDLGKADLRPETREFLGRLSSILARHPYEIEVVGHTDTFPISSAEFPTNWELSTARAARVARFLIEMGRLEPGRFTIQGHSMYRPAVPNTTLENKARNRRVEIVITRRVYRGSGPDGPDAGTGKKP